MCGPPAGGQGGAAALFAPLGGGAAQEEELVCAWRVERGEVGGDEEEAGVVGELGGDAFVVVRCRRGDNGGGSGIRSGTGSGVDGRDDLRGEGGFVLEEVPGCEEELAELAAVVGSFEDGTDECRPEAVAG